jgi:hypothetical protein
MVCGVPEGATSTCILTQETLSLRLPADQEKVEALMASISAIGLQEPVWGAGVFAHFVKRKLLSALKQALSRLVMANNCSHAENLVKDIFLGVGCLPGASSCSSF